MQLAPAPTPTPYEPITERRVMQGVVVTGEEFEITARSDGRFGYSVWLPGVWCEASSERTMGAAQAVVAEIIRIRKELQA